MEIVFSLFAIAILVLAWAVYRINQQNIALREKVIRLSKRVNEMLYKVSRGTKAKPDEETKTSIVGLVEESEKARKIICPNCHSLCSSKIMKCPNCGSLLPMEKKTYDWKDADLT